MSRKHNRRPPLGSIMATQVYAKEIPPKATGSPTAIAAWKFESANTTYVMGLPGGACSVSVMRGAPSNSMMRQSR